MRKLSLLLLSLLVCGVSIGSTRNPDFCDKVKPAQLLSQADAERLLGQPVRLTQNTSELRGDVRQCMCAYTGLSKDTASGQDCVVYFGVEQREKNPSVEQAKQVLVSTKEANLHDSFVADLSGVGEEAFLLSNDEHSHLIMARKGPIILRLQVKHAAGSKSQDEAKAIAERVLKGL